MLIKLHCKVQLLQLTTVVMDKLQNPFSSSFHSPQIIFQGLMIRGLNLYHHRLIGWSWNLEGQNNYQPVCGSYQVQGPQSPCQLCTVPERSYWQRPTCLRLSTQDGTVDGRCRCGFSQWLSVLSRAWLLWVRTYHWRIVRRMFVESHHLKKFLG